MKSDLKLRHRVESELAFSSDIEAGGIAVVVESSAVKLIGQVGSLREKARAERIAHTVCGVTQVVNEIRVVPKGQLQIDMELLQQLLWALVWSVDPTEALKPASATVAGRGVRSNHRRFT